MKELKLNSSCVFGTISLGSCVLLNIKTIKLPMKGDANSGVRTLLSKK